MERQTMVDRAKAKLPNILRLFILLILFIAAPLSRGFCGATFMRFLYPSFGGTWATPWIAKEAGYFGDEGLDVELVRVGGSTRIVAALLGGSAPLIHAATTSAIAASVAGSDVVLIAAAKLGMKELIKVSDLGYEDVTGAVITTRAFLSQQRDTALRFMKAFIRGAYQSGGVSPRGGRGWSAK